MEAKPEELNNSAETEEEPDYEKLALEELRQQGLLPEENIEPDEDDDESDSVADTSSDQDDDGSEQISDEQMDSEQEDEQPLVRIVAGERVRIVIGDKWIDCLVLMANPEKAMILPLSADGTGAINIGQRIAVVGASENHAKVIYGSVKDTALVPTITLTDFGGPTFAERRKSIRIRALIKAEVWRSDERSSENTIRIGVTREISTTGFSLRINDGEDLRQGMQMKIKMYPAEGGIINASGIIKQIYTHEAGPFKSYEIAIEFDEIEQSSKEQIAKMILKRYPHCKREELL